MVAVSYSNYVHVPLDKLEKSGGLSVKEQQNVQILSPTHTEALFL